MLAPLCLTIDPAARSAVALVEPAERPRLLVLRIVEADTRSEWAERVVLAMAAMRDAAKKRPVLIWIENTPVGNRVFGSGALDRHRGQWEQEAHGVGFIIDDLPRWEEGIPLTTPGLAYINSQSWPGILGLSPGKKGDGSHRIGEAEALVEMPANTLRGLGKGTVDASEAILMGAALSRVVLGLPRIPRAKPRTAKPRKGRAA